MEDNEHRKNRRSSLQEAMRRQSASTSNEHEEWQPEALYSPTTPSSATPFAKARPPPSSFSFPFQAHPGNPDPGMVIPGVSSRRSSVESLRQRSNSSSDMHELGRPYAPFMSDAPARHSPTSETPPIPRTPSATFRAPFLSPASRPSSTVWSPPSYPTLPNFGPDSPTASSSALAMPKAKPPLPSTRLTEKLTKEDKPWLQRTPTRERLSYWITLICIFLGIAGAAVLCFFGATTVDLLDESQLCPVLMEDFSSGSLDESIWRRDVQLGGFGNGEFEITTNSDDNLKIQNGQLYIIPTLTSDQIGRDKVLDGGEYTVDGCTEVNNQSACTAKSDANSHTVINPVMSARVNTSGTASIRYGKVEVRAKNPTGDWLWPAIWMLPVDNKYGEWPLSGEIDIMEARGNLNTYGAQGVNFVRSSLNYGPLESLVTKIYGWWQMKRGGYNDDFHTYTLEWTESWMRVYVDSRLQAMLDLTIKKEKNSFFNRGHYPATTQDGANQVVVQNIYSGGGWNAPFDQEFCLVIDLAAGGTSGWFPDDIGDKPWHDESTSAMEDFAKAQDTWSATWPENIDDRAFRIDSVKMWQLGGC